MDILCGWIRGLVAASVTASLAKLLTPAGPVRKVTAFVSGIVLLSALLSPALKADTEAFSAALSDYRATAAALTDDMERQEKQLLRVYIEQQSAAYILDEARRLGLPDLSVTVRAKWGDESWIPCEVSLTGPAEAGPRQRMTEFLTSELGIPAERQHWDG
ncbi:MAG: hypothetical protein IKQ10_03485 [Oscillospiraceae bacterium]|nr:hypothetical protein [Oscillospiraceae bacterium]